MCFLPCPLWCHQCPGNGTWMIKALRSSGEWPSLLKVKYSHGRIQHLSRRTGSYSITCHPESLRMGNIPLTVDLWSSSWFFIAHPLLCNLFSRYLPETEMAGYDFVFAFPHSLVTLKHVHDCPNWRLCWVCLNSGKLPSEIRLRDQSLLCKAAKP